MVNSTAGSRPRSKVEIRIISSRSYRRLGVFPVFRGECSANRPSCNDRGRPSDRSCKRCRRDPPSQASEAQEGSHVHELAFELPRKPGVTRRATRHVPERSLQHAARYRKVRPSDDLVAPQERQRVVAKLPQARRRVGFEAVCPVPEELETRTVPDNGIERREQAHAIHPRRTCLLYTSDAADER